MYFEYVYIDSSDIFYYNLISPIDFLALFRLILFLCFIQGRWAWDEIASVTSINNICPVLARFSVTVWEGGVPFFTPKHSFQIVCSQYMKKLCESMQIMNFDQMIIRVYVTSPIWRFANGTFANGECQHDIRQLANVVRKFANIFLFRHSIFANWRMSWRNSPI